MKKINILESMEYIDAGFILEADSYKAKSSVFNWVKWGTAAACLCLVVVSAIFLISPHSHAPIARDGESTDLGGLFPDGIDPATYSMALYPATEDAKNIETADVTNIKEADLQKIPLAEHLPTELPEGFHFGRGNLYETVMKDGTHYHMLHVEYMTGSIPEQKYSEDDGEIAPDMSEMGEYFLVIVVDFIPRTCSNIYSPDEITVQMLGDADIPYIQYGDSYVGITAETADAVVVLDTIKSIR